MKMSDSAGHQEAEEMARDNKLGVPSPPERIYLQTHDLDWTWCGDRIDADSDDPDTEYVRADLYDDLLAQLREARKPFLCGVCNGSPLASGRLCICGGAGTEQAEMLGLRVALYEADGTVERLEAQLREAEKDSQRLDFYEANPDCVVVEKTSKQWIAPEESGLFRPFREALDAARRADTPTEEGK